MTSETTITETTIKIADREVRVHPAAGLFPMMSDAELDELTKDIREHGLQHGLVFWTPDDKQYGAGPPEENFLIDGRNRLLALERAFDDPGEREASLKDALGDEGMKIFGVLVAKPTQLYGRTDPFAYVVSANLRRRQLTAEQHREVIAALVKANPEKSNRQIAAMADSNRTTVGEARSELEAKRRRVSR